MPHTLSAEELALLDSWWRAANYLTVGQIYLQQARKAVGALAVALFGLDALVFTGGIGEHAVPIRERICAGLGHLGSFAVHVFPADEERVIARHVQELLPGAARIRRTRCAG